MPVPRVARRGHCLRAAGRHSHPTGQARGQARTHQFGDGFKADIIVAHELILEIKAVTAILPIHEVQLRNRTKVAGRPCPTRACHRACAGGALDQGVDPAIRMSGIHIGLLLNFNAPRLVDGLRRYVM